MKKHLILSFFLACFAMVALSAQTPGREAGKPKNARTEKHTKPVKATPGAIAKARGDHDARWAAKNKPAKHKMGKKNPGHGKHHKPKHADKKYGSATRPTRQPMHQPHDPTEAHAGKKVTPAQPSAKAAKVQKPQPVSKTRKTSPASTPTDPKDAKMAPQPTKPVKATPGGVARARRGQ